MDLPVGLAGDVDVVEVSSVIFGIGSSKQQLATGLRFRVPDMDSSVIINVAVAKNI